jgi:hypothetical protein
MKTIILIISLLLVPIQLFAQLESGTFLLGGGLSATINNSNYSGDLSNESDEFEFSFYPEVGYFIIENFAAGLNAKIGTNSLSYNWQPTNSNNEINTFEYALGPYLRYYTPIESFAFYFELNYQIGNANRTTYVTHENGQFDSEESKDDISISLFTPAIGLGYFINKSVGIKTEIRYEIGKRKFDLNTSSPDELSYEQEISSFVLLLGLQIHLNFN